MNAERQDDQAMVQRLNRLEREIRAWKALTRTCWGLLGLVFLLGATGERGTKTFDEIRARQFVLVDADGKARGGLRVGSDNSAALALADPNGRILAGLAVPSDGFPRLRFYDGDGKARGGLGAGRDGTVSLALADKDGALHLWAGAREIVQIPLNKTQRFWKPVTVLAARSANSEDYSPVDAELPAAAQSSDSP